MLAEKEAIKDTDLSQGSHVVTGNEAEEFITKIVLKVLFTAVVMVVGVGIAFYYTSGAV